MIDVTTALAIKREPKIVGISPDKKTHEEVTTAIDSFTTYDLGICHAILPQVPLQDLQSNLKRYEATEVPEGFLAILSTV